MRRRDRAREAGRRRQRIGAAADAEAERGGFGRADLLPLAIVAACAAAARFTLLDHQSLWFDEIVSATLAKQPFGAMLHDIARTESTPPLYYTLLWIWTRAFGTTAAALRSLSACFGVATAVVVYAAARVRFSRRAAFVAGALTATHPMLVWYSQETRAYALVTLLVSLTLYFLLRAGADGGSTRSLAGWAVAGALAVATHYFAAFVVFPEAAVLVYLLRGRVVRSLLATALPLVSAAALLPLAIHQRDMGHTKFLSTVPLATRLHQTLNEIVIGNYGVSWLNLLALWLVVAAAGALGIALRASRAERRDALALLALGLAAFVLPLVITPSAFFHRNLIVVLPPLLLVAGLAAGTRASGLGAAAVGCLGAAALVVPTVVIAQRRELQREDWRDMAALVGPYDPARAVLTYPRYEYIPLTYYRRRLRVVDSGILHVRELLLVSGRATFHIAHLPAGFRRVEDRRLGKLRIVRLRSPRPQELDVSALQLRPVLRLLAQTGSPGNAQGQDWTLLVERSRR